MQSRSHLETLPKECIEHILLFAEVKDQVRLTQVSKTFNKILQENTALIAQAYKKVEANAKSSMPEKRENWYNGFNSLEEIKAYCLLNPQYDSKFYDLDFRENTYQNISAKNFSREAQKSLRHTQWMLTHRHHNYYPYRYSSESLALDLAKKDIRFLHEYLKRPQWRDMLRSDLTTTPIAKLSVKHCQLVMRYFPVGSEGAPNIIELFHHSEQHKTLLTDRVNYLGPKGLIAVYESTLRHQIASTVKKRLQFIEYILVHYLKKTMLRCITKAPNQVLPPTLFSWSLLLDTMKEQKEKSFQTAYTFLDSIGEPLFFSSKGGVPVYPFKDSYLHLPLPATQLMTNALTAACLELPQNHWAKAKLKSYKANLHDQPLDALKIVLHHTYLQDVLQLNLVCKKLHESIQPYLNYQKSLISTQQKAASKDLFKACQTSLHFTEAFLRSNRTDELSTSEAFKLVTLSRDHASLIFRSRLLQNQPKQKTTKKPQLETFSRPTSLAGAIESMGKEGFPLLKEFLSTHGGQFSTFDKKAFLTKVINNQAQLPSLIEHAWHCFGGYRLMEIAQSSPEAAKQILFHPKARERLKHGHLMGITKASKEHAHLCCQHFAWAIGATGIVDIFSKSSSLIQNRSIITITRPWMQMTRIMGGETRSFIEKLLDEHQPFSNSLPTANTLQSIIKAYEDAINSSITLPQSKKKQLLKIAGQCQNWINIFLDMSQNRRTGLRVDLAKVLLILIRRANAKQKQKKSDDE